MSEASRRSNLRDFVVSRYDDVSAGNTTHAQLLGEAVDLTVQQVRQDYGITYQDSQHPFAYEHAVTTAVVDDLFSVFVGDHVWGKWRGSGDYWHDLHIDPRRGATGFREEFLDNTDQLQHTVAGLWAGYHKNALLEAIANLRENGVADLAINHVTIPIGNNINDLNIDQLGMLLLEALGTPEAVATYLGDTVGPECFLEDSTVQMWPLDPAIKPRLDGSYDEELVLSKVWYKRQDQMQAGDLVVSYDKRGRLQPGRVTRTMTNTSTHILDFWDTGVTPGHVYHCADGPFKGGFAPLMDILRMDGALMRSDGTLYRAATNCGVGSFGDKMLHTVVGNKLFDGRTAVKERGQIRAGTRVILEDGTHTSVLDLIFASGGMITDDGYIQTALGGPKMPYRWAFSDHLPKPEDYILARSAVTLEEIYLANEWEQISTRMPAPDSLSGFNPNSTMKRTKPKPNIPPAFANRPDAPTAKNRAQRPVHASASPSAPGMNRKQRKAMEAKQRKAAKARGRFLHNRY